MRHYAIPIFQFTPSEWTDTNFAMLNDANDEIDAIITI